MMKNVLVTGGAGFIGSNFIRYLLENETAVNIVDLDLLTYAGSMENLKDLPHPERHTFIMGDICDRALVNGIMSHHQIDTIVHFAAETHVDRSILGPAQFIQTNIMGTFSILEAARKLWLDDKALQLENVRFHHVSTDEVFGSLKPSDPPFNESTPYEPRSPYSASKASSDHLVRAYYHTYNLPVTISNCTNNFGPYQFPEKLIPLMITNALAGKDLPVYGDGQQIRDWLYVEDHCEAIARILCDGKTGETYAIGGANQPTNLTLINQICMIMDEMLPDSAFVPHSKLIKYVPDRPGHDRRYDMDITKIKTELGWQPRESLGSGLTRTIEWYLKHPEWLDAIRKRDDYQGWVDVNYKKREVKS
jgi:dTDP-glucose 4,6-dehydratase